MPVLKNVTVSITHKDNVSSFAACMVNTLEFPPKLVGDLITAVTGHALEEDDHGFLNDLHCHGKCAFSFGPDWEFTVVANVTYPDDEPKPRRQTFGEMEAENPDVFKNPQ